MTLYFPIDAEQIMDIPLGEVLHEDMRIWHYTSSGVFSLCPAQHLIMELRKENGAGG